MVEANVEKKPKSFSLVIAENFSSIVAAVLFLGLLGGYFVKGGFAPINTLRDAFTMSAPVATVIAAFLLCKIHFDNVRNREKRWAYSLLLLVVFFAYLLYGIFAGTLDPLYNQLYDLIANGGSGATYGLVALGMISAMARGFVGRTRQSMLMAVVFVFSLIGITPIGIFFPTAISDAANWAQSAIMVPVEQAFWTSVYIGQTAMMARVLLFIEKIKPGM